MDSQERNLNTIKKIRESRTKLIDLLQIFRRIVNSGK